MLQAVQSLIISRTVRRFELVHSYADRLLGVGISGLSPDSLCVNVEKRVDRADDMRQQSRDGAVWIPSQLLEIIPYQTVKAQLPPSLVTSMIRAALRKPAENARLIVQEDLDILRIPGRSQRPLVRLLTDVQ
jgi:hypothetical protein